jgi:hypothetical protein
MLKQTLGKQLTEQEKSQQIIDNLESHLKEAKRQLAYLQDRANRYDDLRNRKTFLKKKSERQFKITKRFIMADRAAAQTIQFIDKLESEIKSVRDTAQKT